MNSEMDGYIIRFAVFISVLLSGCSELQVQPKLMHTDTKVIQQDNKETLVGNPERIPPNSARQEPHRTPDRFVPSLEIEVRDQPQFDSTALTPE